MGEIYNLIGLFRLWKKLLIFYDSFMGNRNASLDYISEKYPSRVSLLGQIFEMVNQYLLWHHFASGFIL